MGSYVPAVVAGDLLFVAGHPPVENGKIKFKGKVGKDITIEDGRHAAELCIINCLASAQAALGNLDRIERVVKLTGYVNSSDDFEKQPDVINGASDYSKNMGRERASRTRGGGAISLPANISVEVEAVFKVKS